MSSILTPCIHLNGTSAKELQDDYRKAWHALIEAKAALANITIHDRDYYVINDRAGWKARKHRTDMLDTLSTLAHEIYSVWETLEEK